MDDREKQTLHEVYEFLREIARRPENAAPEAEPDDVPRASIRDQLPPDRRAAWDRLWERLLVPRPEDEGEPHKD